MTMNFDTPYSEQTQGATRPPRSAATTSAPEPPQPRAPAVNNLESKATNRPTIGMNMDYMEKTSYYSAQQESERRAPGYGYVNKLGASPGLARHLKSSVRESQPVVTDAKPQEPSRTESSAQTVVQPKVEVSYSPAPQLNTMPTAPFKTSSVSSLQVEEVKPVTTTSRNPPSIQLIIVEEDEKKKMIKPGEPTPLLVNAVSKKVTIPDQTNTQRDVFGHTDDVPTWNRGKEVTADTLSKMASNTMSLDIEHVSTHTKSVNDPQPITFNVVSNSSNKTKTKKKSSSATTGLSLLTFEK